MIADHGLLIDSLFEAVDLALPWMIGAALAEAYELFPRLRDRQRQLAGTLSGGEQRMLSLARVLVDKPRLLIADELSLGLAPIIVEVHAEPVSVWPYVLLTKIVPPPNTSRVQCHV